jgi:hypothetical protein
MTCIFGLPLFVSTQGSCKALEGMYIIASPDSQARHRPLYANHTRHPDNLHERLTQCTMRFNSRRFNAEDSHPLPLYHVKDR